MIPAVMASTGAGGKPRQKRMYGWLKPTSLKKKRPFARGYGPVGVSGYHPPRKPPRLTSLGSTRRPKTGLTVGRRRLSSGLGGTRRRAPSVYGTAIKKGQYGSTFKRGTTQTTQAVRSRGLVWGGRLFRNRGEFSRSLQAHGTNIQTFSKRHRQAFAGLARGKAVNTTRNGLTTARSRPRRR